MRLRRGAGAVERGGLENRWACKRPLGSNPSPAARRGAPSSAGRCTRTFTLVRMRGSSAALLLCVLLLAGCGGSSSGDAEEQITAPAYNGYPAITIPVETGTQARCRHEAEAFSREAVAFLAPFPSDSDTHLVIARLQFFEFTAHRCNLAMLRATFARHATPHQRRTIVDRIEFTFLGDAGSELGAR